MLSNSNNNSSASSVSPTAEEVSNEEKYKKISVLGQFEPPIWGCSVHLMQPRNGKGKLMVLKEVVPDLVFTNIQYKDIEAIFRSKYELFQKEVVMTPKEMNASFFCRNMNESQLVVKSMFQRSIVSDYPRCYIAMDYLEGVRLTDFDVKSPRIFFDICISILKELQRLHTQVVHGDIHSGNIIVNEHQGKITTHIIDYFFCRSIGETLILSKFLPQMSLLSKPPEFKNNPTIVVHPNQDVFGAGNLFKKLYDKCSYKNAAAFSSIADQIQFLVNSMTAESPEDRISMELALELLKECDASYKKGNSNVNLSLFTSKISELCQKVESDPLPKEVVRRNTTPEY